MSRPALVALALAAPLVLGGCAVFNNLFKPKERPPAGGHSTSLGGLGASGQGGAPPVQEQREQELKEAHARLSAEIAASRAGIGESGVDSTRALRFAELTVKAFDSQAVARGRIAGPALAAEAQGYLASAAEAEPHALGDLKIAGAALHQRVGDDDAAGRDYAAAIAFEADVHPFEALVSLGPSPVRDALVVDACAAVRPLIAADAVVDFVDVCLGRAAGDADALRWASARRDLSAYQAAMKRRAQEAAERAKIEAAEASKREGYLIAAVFAAGVCEFGDCSHRGWTTRTDRGEIRASCNFGECLTRGWETRFPDGTTARTECSFGECLQRGWETRFPDGSSARTECSFGECATRGWETRLPDGSSSRTTCQFSECFTRGWETSLPNGGSIRCNCSFGECLTRGTECS